MHGAARRTLRARAWGARLETSRRRATRRRRLRVAVQRRLCRCVDCRGPTCSNVRLFGKMAVAAFPRAATLPRHVASLRRRRPEGSRELRNETHFPAVEDPPCAHAWLSRAHEDRRRPQGPLRAPREGPRAAFGLTGVGNARRDRGLARYRLRGAKAFEALFRRGTRHDAEFLQLIAAPAAQAPGRIGFVIARKAMRRAVDRNRLRRKLREAVRTARPAIDAFDIVLRVRRSVARDEIAAAAAEGALLLRKLGASQ